MTNVNVNDEFNIEVIKHYIKDLSFENPQSIEENNLENNKNCNISQNMSLVHTPRKNNFFSLNVKYNLDCSSKKNKLQLFNLELDYFGFFEILHKKNHDQKILTETGIKILFPFVKEIIEDLTRKGGSVPIVLNEIGYDLKKN